MANIFIEAVVLGLCLLTADGKPNERFVLDNPADMSTYLGYENHGIHDMSSLVNEAKAKAHGQSATGSGTNGAASGTPYNVPNYPGQTGGAGTSGAANAQGHGLSFAGTNLWRCDAHVIEVCDLNCLDVDPKDGCPFCIQTCQTTLHGSIGQGVQTGSSTSSSQSGSSAQQSIGQSGSPFQQPSSGTGSQIGLSQVGSPFQQPSSGVGSQTGSGQSGSASQGSGSGSQQPSGLSGTATQSGGSQSGSISQQPSGLSGTGSGNSQSGSAAQLPSGLTGTGSQSGTSQSGGIVQQPSGLSGTGSQAAGQGTSASSNIQTTTKPACPHYPPNCPAVYTKLINGCLVCTILQQAGVVTNVPTTTHGPTCPPKRCMAPCNVGIILGADGCPRCKCPDHI